ncbi:sodium:calcium antiporter [Tessaracoccus sp. Z1128]
MSDLVAVIGFVACATAIFVAGGRLSRYGDRIADLSGWGSAWVGLILMASVTSLPELIVGVSSSALVGSADLAVGDVLGSCAINLLILASLDIFVPSRRRLFAVASPSHVLAAALGIVLLATVGIGLLTGDSLALTPWIGLSSLVFLGLYLGSVRLIFRHARGIPPDPSVQPPLDETLGPRDAATAGLSLRQVVARYAWFAGIVVVAAVLLPPAAEVIARMSGLEESYVGTVFLALSTSLPELAVSLAAIRMGAIDLAVGNILGSNLFNILILAIDDVAYTDGLLLADASPSHLFTVMTTIAMSAIAIIGLTNPPSRGKRFLLAGDAALMLVVYAGNAVMLVTLQPQ